MIYCINSISDDDDNNNNIRNFWDLDGLVYSIPNSKKFSFYRQNIHSVVDHLGDRFVLNMDINDRGGYIVFNTGIGNHENMRRIQ